MKNLNRLTKALLSVSALSLVASNAFAAGTAAGTNVQNTFTLDYDVSGVSQPQIDTGTSGTNTPTEFTVDRLIDLTVAGLGDQTAVPGAQNQQLVFSVLNNGNDTQAYQFGLTNESGDEFDASNLTVTYYVDDNDNTFETNGQDGPGTSYVDGSGDATSDLLMDRIIWVVIEGDMPASLSDLDEADIGLFASTLEPSTGASPGTVVTADSGGNSLTGAAENVLADGTGLSGDVANDGGHSASSSFVIESPDLTGSKAVTVFAEDGTDCANMGASFTGGTHYSVPGACVQYVITVTNTGATAVATNIAVSDTLPAELTYMSAAHSGFTGGAISAPVSTTNCSTSTCTIALTSASLAAGANGSITIRALVN